MWLVKHTFLNFFLVFQPACRFLVTDNRVFNKPVARSLRSFASFTGLLTHFAHSLVGQLKVWNSWICVHAEIVLSQITFWHTSTFLPRFASNTRKMAWLILPFFAILSRMTSASWHIRCHMPWDLGNISPFVRSWPSFSCCVWGLFHADLWFCFITQISRLSDAISLKFLSDLCQALMQ